MKSLADLTATAHPGLEPAREQIAWLDQKTPILVLCVLERCDVVELDGRRELVSLRRLHVDPSQLRWQNRPLTAGEIRHTARLRKPAAR